MGYVVSYRMGCIHARPAAKAKHTQPTLVCDRDSRKTRMTLASLLGAFSWQASGSTIGETARCG